MMRTMMTMAIELMLLVGATMAAQEEKTAVEREFEARTTELRDAEVALEAEYLRMEAAYTSICAALPETIARVTDAILADAEALQSRLLTGPGGRRPTKNAQLLIAADGLVDTLDATAVDPGFHAALANRLVERILPSLTDPALEGLSERTDVVLREVFVPDRDFAEVWNDALYTHVGTAHVYHDAHAAYIEAGRRVERERSPERFAAGGERLPPGMVEVKGGQYQLGPHAGWERKGIGRRGKRVTLRTFYIDRTEVTNDEYHAYWKTLELTNQLERLPRYWEKGPDGTYTIPEGRADHPVVGVSFNDALAYATWAGKRLPTEEEWEAAARGARGTHFPWGDQYAPGNSNDREAGLGDTAPVGSFPGGRSAFGCDDMSGNVEEWTATTADGDVIEGPLESNLVQVAVRGGNFNSGSDVSAAVFRWIAPGLSTRKPHLGFRCAMDVKKSK